MLATMLAACTVLTCCQHADASHSDVTHQVFAFVGTQLTVDVYADGPGVLHLTRGGPGRVEVRARAGTGVTAAGLARRPHRLSLAGFGTDRVEYSLVVPDQARVRVRLPDRPVGEIFGVLQDVVTFTWPATPEP